MARKKNVTFNDIAQYTHFSKTTISRYFNNPDSLTEKNQKIIYDLWCSYVEKLLDTVEIHTTDANKDIIKDALMVYGRKKITILLRSPE